MHIYKDDYFCENLDKIPMKIWNSYPREHPRSYFTGHGTGVLDTI